MLPKFGLFDFLECKSVDVALMSDIKWADSGPPKDVNDVIQSGRVVTVQWRKKGGAARCKGKKMPKVQEFQAKLLKVHGMYFVSRFHFQAVNWAYRFRLAI